MTSLQHPCVGLEHQDEQWSVAVSAAMSPSGSATVTVNAECPERRRRLRTFARKCTQTPRCALVPKVNPSSTNDKRAPAAVHQRYPVVMCVVDVVEWSFDAQEAVGGDEPAVVRELDTIFGRTDSERQREQRELGVDGVLEDRVDTRSGAGVLISP
jgi:hypothetical protein